MRTRCCNGNSWQDYILDLQEQTEILANIGIMQRVVSKGESVFLEEARRCGLLRIVDNIFLPIRIKISSRYFDTGTLRATSSV